MAFVLMEIKYESNDIYTKGQQIMLPVMEHGKNTDALQIKKFSSWMNACNFAEQSNFKNYVIYETAAGEKRNHSS